MMQAVKPKFELNYPMSAVSANIARNLARGLPQLRPYQVQEKPIGLICGGPSLDEGEIRRKYDSGMKLVSMNGSHDWLLEHGMHPSAHIMVDSRPWNARFIKNWDKRTKYLIASQCHPKVFDTLKGADIYLWHACLSKADEPIVAEYGEYFTTPGGSTVTLRALFVLRMLGFMNIEIWGFDSCIMDGKHHAYDMPENDGEKHSKVSVGGKEFICEPWMHSQATEFQGIAKMLGNELNLIIHGDGLIAHIVKTGANVAEKQEI